MIRRVDGVLTPRLRVLMLFLDGVGIGRRDPQVNPFFVARMPALRQLLEGDIPSLHNRHRESRLATLIPLDANLGIAGLPQSGTGQTALFTGINASRLIGKHFGPYPYSTLRPVIEAHNVFRRVQQMECMPAFANSFPQRFFDYVALHKTRLSVTTLSCMYAGVRLNRAEDMRAGKGISADITGEGWPGPGDSDIPLLTPREAGRRLASISDANDFTLFEYWKTDYAGHSRNMEDAVLVLERFDGLLEGILENLDLTRTLVVITSDHGNIEDLSTKTHTRHPVPLVLASERHQAIAERIRHYGGRAPDLTHVLPVILEVMCADHGDALAP